MTKDTPDTNSDDVLSPKEKDVLHLVRHGKSTAEIATIMDISPRTVKFHVGNIMEKLNAVNRTHAVVLALERKLIYEEKRIVGRGSRKSGNKS
jgi:LuxR family transcriptional regulator, quorum-sensing system regulator ExpR